MCLQWGSPALDDAAETTAAAVTATALLAAPAAVVPAVVPAAAAAPAAAQVRTRVRIPLRLADGYAVEADVYTFDGLLDGKEHVALGLGDYRDADVPLVRVHSECLTGDVFGSARCDCGPQLREAVGRVAAAGGYLLYLLQEGRGVGLYTKLDAYALQDFGLDTYAANRALGHADDERSYAAAAQILSCLGAERVDLLTNNPDKTAQLRALGIDVRKVLATGVHLSPHNLRYLAAKASFTAHTIELPLPN